MSVARLSPRGAITIPKDVRERLNLQAGQKLIVTALDDGTIRLRPIEIKESLEAHIGALRKAQAKPVKDGGRA